LSHGGTPLAFVELDESGYFKLKSEDREAKMKEVVRSVCLDPDGIAALDGLSARKMSVATWHPIPKKPIRHLLWKARPPEGSKTSTQRM